MKNLKRILSLALASVMVMGMMVVGASAADFNDKDQIDHTEAVETLVALGIISGKEGNRFDPKGTLTRAEMATIISVIRNKGIAPNFGTKATPTYSDIDGHWAESYIEYCSSFGIVGGIGGGKFDPEGTLTATQAARMILNAMGYTIEDPSNWALLTEVQAREEGVDLYAGIDEEIADPTNATITRDQMAQMACNALYAPVANAEVTQATVYILTNAAGTDLGHGYFDTIVDAQAYATMNSISGAQVRRTTATVTETLGAKYLGLTTDDSIVVSSVSYDADRGTYTVGSYTTTTDVTQFMGQKVKVLYKTNRDNSKTVFGVVPTGTVLYTGVVGDITRDAASSKTLTIGGTNYRYNSNEITTWNTGVKSAISAVNDWNELTVIDNTGDGKIDMMISKPVTVVKVGNVGKTSIVAGKTYTFKDNDIEAGLKKDDWVTIVDTLESGSKIAKVPTVENVTATVKSADDVYTIGGEKYTAATGSELDAIVLGKSYNLVAINGAVFEATLYTDGTASAGVDTLVYALRAADAKAGTDDLGGVTDAETQQVELMFTDGTKKIVTVTKLDGDPVKHESDTNEVVKNTLYTYKTDRNGNYELTAAPAALASLGSLTGVAVATTDNLADGKIETTYLNNDAILFVHLKNTDGEDEVKVLTGAEVGAWTLASDGDFADNSIMYTETKNGNFQYAAAGVLHLAAAYKSWPGSVSSTKYGYITTDAVNVYDATLKDTFAQITIWNGEENVTRLYTLGNGETLANFAAGTMVKYTEGDNNTLVTLADLSATADAVTAYAGGDDIRFETSAVTSLKDAVIIFIDDDKNAGVAEGEASIQLAAEHAEVAELLVKNVYIAKDGDQVVLFVDNENEVNDQIAVYAVTYKISNTSEAKDNARSYTVVMDPANGKVAKADGAKVTLTITQGAEVEGYTDTVKIGDTTLSFTNGVATQEVSVSDADVEVVITVTTASNG